jgi:GH25 family lysozyme M1 (1,4-beta-N-acetylmuramidase)
MSGIDVSRWQGNIDWAQVKGGGIKFAIIRAGYLASNENPLFHLDTQFVKNVKEAKKQGIAVGVYLYVYAYNDSLISQSLDSFHNSAAMKELRKANIRFDLPVYLDVEDSFFYDNTGGSGGYATRTKVIRNGMKKLKKLGYTPGFYTFYSWAQTAFDAAKLQNEGYSFWLARWYTNSPQQDPYKKDVWSATPHIWQYSSKGSVKGISGNVDLNFLYTKI